MALPDDVEIDESGPVVIVFQRLELIEPPLKSSNTTAPKHDVLRIIPAVNEVIKFHSHPTGRLSLERKNGLVLS
jgi:hypothetical protein